MTITAETRITKEQFANISLKLAYQKFAVRFMIFAGSISLALLMINWVRHNGLFDTDLPMFPFWLVLYNIFLPFMTYGNAQKHYDSNRGLRAACTYSLDEEKVSWVEDGAEGYAVWGYFINYNIVNDFLLLFTSNTQVIFIPVHKLRPEEINFIQSKIAIIKN